MNFSGFQAAGIRKAEPLMRLEAVANLYNKALGITPRVSVHHGVTMSLYYRDPDDNGVELSIDNVEKANWHEWMRNELGKTLIRMPLDPDDLARKYHAGTPEAELRAVLGTDPEVLRRMVE